MYLNRNINLHSGITSINQDSTYFYFHMFDYQSQTPKLKKILQQIDRHSFENSTIIVNKGEDYSIEANTIHRFTLMQCTLCIHCCMNFTRFNTMLLHYKYFHPEFLFYFTRKSINCKNVFHILCFPNTGRNRDDNMDFLYKDIESEQIYTSCYLNLNKAKRKRYVSEIIMSMSLENLDFKDR